MKLARTMKRDTGEHSNEPWQINLFQSRASIAADQLDAREGRRVRDTPGSFLFKQLKRTYGRH